MSVVVVTMSDSDTSTALVPPDRFEEIQAQQQIDYLVTAALTFKAYVLAQEESSENVHTRAAPRAPTSSS